MLRMVGWWWGNRRLFGLDAGVLLDKTRTKLGLQETVWTWCWGVAGQDKNKTGITGDCLDLMLGCCWTRQEQNWDYRRLFGLDAGVLLDKTRTKLGLQETVWTWCWGVAGQDKNKTGITVANWSSSNQNALTDLSVAQVHGFCKHPSFDQGTDWPR